MSGDREIVVMGKVFDEMEGLNQDERKRVLSWLIQKLGVEVSLPSASPEGRTSLRQAADVVLDLSTDTIATVLGAKSGPDIIIAAAAHLHFVKSRQKFTRQELTAEMRTAPAHFKDTYVNNLSKYLTGLTKADRLRLVGSDTYALSSRERQGLEAKLVSAA